MRPGPFTPRRARAAAAATSLLLALPLLAGTAQPTPGDAARTDSQTLLPTSSGKGDVVTALWELPSLTAPDRTVYDDHDGHDDHTANVDDLPHITPAPPKRTEHPYAYWSNKPLSSPSRRFPTSQAFNLSSRPEAPVTLYLNFTGHDLADTAWVTADQPDTTLAPWTLDRDPSTFNTNERVVITAVWEAVAEDFAPFDINVTTKAPPLEDLERSDEDDDRYGTMILITGSTNWLRPRCHGCIGVAYIDAVAQVSDMSRRIGLVFNSYAEHPYTQRTIADIVTHEAGHHYGLHHRGVGVADYHPGNGAWGPLMGTSVNNYLSQWSDGRYSGSRRRGESETEMIAARSGWVPDDFPGKPAEATPLRVGQPRAGLIGRNPNGSADVDTFTVTSAKPVFVEVTPTGFPANLNAELVIRNATGRQTGRRSHRYQSFGPAKASGLGASTILEPRNGPTTWTVSVRGTAGRAPSAYGSMGHYKISATRPPKGYRLKLNSPRLHQPRAGRLYRTPAATRTGGRRPFRWSATGLPRGLRVDAYTGALVGRAKHGTKPRVIRVTVRDRDGQKATTRVRVHVHPKLPRRHR